jgi:hypothetical protein
VPDIRVNDLPVLAAPTDADVLHAIDDADDKDKQLTVGALKAFAQSGTATAAQGAKADTALQPGQAATTAQGAKADTALQPGSVNLGTTATTSTRTVTNTAGAAAVLPTFDTNAGLVPGTASGTSNFLRADGTWAAPAGGAGTVTGVIGTAPIVSSGGAAPAISIVAATASVPGSMSAADKTKLDTLTASANGTVTNVTGTAPISVATGTSTPAITIAAATTGAAGSMSGADKTKLDGVAPGATANSTDAQLRDRSTHTGTQLAATISLSGASLVGRSSAGVAQEITLGTNLSFTGTVLNATGGGGGVSAVTGTAPIVSSGGGSPAISITPASGSAPGSMSSADFTKLAGIATGATANDTDANLKNRANHTGTQLAATISDFTASSRAQTEAMLTAGTNVTLTPSGTGATRSVQISATAGGGGVSTVTGTAPIVSSGGGSPAISITAATGSVPGSMSAADKTKLDGIAAGATANVGTVTGVTGTAPITSSGGAAPAIGIAAATTSLPGSMSAADKAKLDGVAAGATANSTDAQLRDRSTHTGTQLAATISDFTASSRAQVEATLVAGANVTLTPAGSGATRTIAIASTAAGGGGGTVTSVTGTAPIQVVSNTTTPSITIDAATTSVPGSMSAADKTKLNAITGTNTGDNAPNSLYSGLVSNATHTGDATGATALTLATVNANVGAFGSATQVATFTVNAKGLTTAASNVTVTPAWSSITATPTTRAGYGITDAAANGAVTGTGITMSTARLLGRSTAATGAIEEITLGTNLSFTGTTLNATGGGGAANLALGTLTSTTVPVTNSNGTGFTLSAATGSVAGVMSSADFTKLAAITGTNTGDNAPNSLYSGLVSNATHTGDATGATALTLATVNSNVGSFGSATAMTVFTVNAKGLITAASTVPVAPAIGSVTGLGTGVGTALAVNTGSAGAFGVVVAKGTAALGTAAIASGVNATTVTVAAAGVTTTDVIDWGFNANPNVVTGYNAASTTGCLVITCFPTAGNVNFVVSNPTAASITRGALTLNWTVVR